MEQHTLLQREESPRSPAALFAQAPGWLTSHHALGSRGSRSVGGRQQGHCPTQSALVGRDGSPGLLGVDALAGAGVADAPGRLRLFNQ